MKTLILSATIFGSLATGAVARPPAAEPRTEAAVLAADDDWLAAERRGDVAALDRRLADGYRDIEPTGKVHPKAELLAWTANRKNPETGSATEVAADFRKKNPVVEKVVIIGDTAILSFHSVDPAMQALARSTDVFTYEHGVWRGVLSQHSSVPSKAG